MNWYLKVMKQYADFSGRARRKEYWMFTLMNMVFCYGIVIVAALVDVPELMFLALAYVFATIIPTYAAAARRMHDVGKSGWFVLIPYYNIYLLCLNGEEGENQYGPDPKRAEEVILQKV